MTKVVTRIAPSPTGDMHLGTARTALFNYLYARRHHGDFRLRIEDTDKERSTQAAVDVIFRGLDWLELEHDGDVVFQSQNADRHVEVAMQLLASGHAYYDYMSADETTAWKEANKGKAFRSMFRDMPGPSPGMTRTVFSTTPPVVRFKGRMDGTTVVKDMIKGDVSFENVNLDDLVLLRSDGTPTYNLAVVVDDHDMGVTHVIRGDDHLNNAARQQLIYEALGWDVPAWAHLPLIHGPDGKKLSKRNGDASIFDYATLGYLPEGMRNYLTRLGWGHGDDEIFSDAQAVEWFDVADVVSAPARLDYNKLNHINNHYLRNADDTRLAELVTEHYALAAAYENDAGLIKPARLINAIHLLKEGAPTINKLAEIIWFAVAPKIEFDEKATKALADPDGKAMLNNFVPFIELSMQEAFKAAYNAVGIDGPAKMAELVNLDVRRYAQEFDVPMKLIGTTVRAALTGTTQAPDLGTLMVVLGWSEAKERLLAAYDRV